jgi:hypothetical protein
MPTKIQLPAITQAGDKQLLQESIMITIEASTFSIHSGPGNRKFNEWLGSTDLSMVSANYKNGHDAITNLDFPYFSRFPHQRPHIVLNRDLEMMVACKNLTKVSMTWVGEELVNVDGDNFDAKPVVQLCQEYRLDRLLKCDKLKTNRLVGRGVWGASHSALDNLAAWRRASMPSTAEGQTVTVITN